MQRASGLYHQCRDGLMLRELARKWGVAAKGWSRKWAGVAAGMGLQRASGLYHQFTNEVPGLS